jgi:hypothetical protein
MADGIDGFPWLRGRGRIGRKSQCKGFVLATNQLLPMGMRSKTTCSITILCHREFTAMAA